MRTPQQLSLFVLRDVSAAYPAANEAPEVAEVIEKVDRVLASEAPQMLQWQLVLAELMRIGAPKKD